ncbi:MAG: hypothetical protein ACI9CD_001261 [Candidatus Deianiraeaceae bacterium]|jgi:hypothetical protein
MACLIPKDFVDVIRQTKEVSVYTGAEMFIRKTKEKRCFMLSAKSTNSDMRIKILDKSEWEKIPNHKVNYKTDSFIVIAFYNKNTPDKLSRITITIEKEYADCHQYR